MSRWCRDLVLEDQLQAAVQVGARLHPFANDRRVELRLGKMSRSAVNVIVRAGAACRPPLLDLPDRDAARERLLPQKPFALDARHQRRRQAR
jgi:hypothetical protein